MITLMIHKETNPEFGKLDLDDLGVTVRRCHFIKCGVSTFQPTHELLYSVLELSQVEEGVLQLSL